MSEILEFDDNGNQIPDTVVNKKAYKEYLKLNEAPFFREEIRIIYTSENDLIIDPFSNDKHINDDIIYLPKEEQDQIKRKVKGYKLALRRLDALKKKAYGINTNKVNQKESGNVGKFIVNERAVEILEYFGRFLEAKEIKDILFEQWGYEVSVQTLRNFKNKNYVKIKALKEEYSSDIRSLKYTHKKSRVEVLTKLLDDRLKDYQNGDAKRSNHEMILKTLREISSIVDDEINVNVSGTVEHQIAKSLERKEAEDLLSQKTLLSLIISNVSQKMDVNPEYFTSMLTESIYAKNSGFGGDDVDIKERDILYPTSFVYNEEEIKKKNRVDLPKMELLKKMPEKVEGNENKREVLRKTIAEKIKQKQESLKGIERRIDQNKK